MNVLSIAKIERHMAGEIHQISHAHIRNMGRMDGVASFSSESRQMEIPHSRYAMLHRPEQSMPAGVLPPQR